MIPQLNTLLALCGCALPVWLLLRGAWLLMRRPRRRPKLLREIALCLFSIFMVGILCMALEGKWQSPPDMLRSALSRLQTGEKIHPRLFHTIGPQVKALPSLNSVTQLLGNTLLFSPWGFFLPLLWPRFRKGLTMIGMALLLTCFIEGTQLFIDRFVELDDILLNFLGSMLGTGAWYLLHLCCPRLDNVLLDAA